MTRIEILTKAAGKLNELARDIKDSNTVNGQWLVEDPAQADHDECVQLAAGLLLLAKASA